MQSNPPAIQELASAIFAAARAASEPVQAQIVDAIQREQEVKWIGVAYEALSFHMVLATRMAQVRSVEMASRLVDRLGELIVPRIAATFFATSPRDAQEKATRAFLEGHLLAEGDYGSYKALFPRGPDHDPDCVVARFADRLLTVVDRDLDQSAHDRIVSEVVGAVESSMKTLEFPRLVQVACDALTIVDAPPEA